jgi:hypothetical protein
MNKGGRRRCIPRKHPHLFHLEQQKTKRCAQSVEPCQYRSRHDYRESISWTAPKSRIQIIHPKIAQKRKRHCKRPLAPHFFTASRLNFVLKAGHSQQNARTRDIAAARLASLRLLMHVVSNAPRCSCAALGVSFF